VTITNLSFLLAVLSLAVPLAGEAQQAGRTYRIGVLEVTGASSNAANLGAFQDELRGLGYVEGENLVIEYRSADGRNERLADLATELVRLRVDAIVTRGEPAAIAAKHAAATIPIVMASSGDPAVAGIVASLARPGGNVTGFHTSAVYVHRILHGANPADLPVEAPIKFELAINLKAARALGLTIPPSLLRRADYIVQ
jgi:ABC-type uncharacterized transport system substrate-binding protein